MQETILKNGRQYRSHPVCSSDDQTSSSASAINKLYPDIISAISVAEPEPKLNCLLKPETKSKLRIAAPAPAAAAFYLSKTGM